MCYIQIKYYDHVIIPHVRHTAVSRSRSNAYLDLIILFIGVKHFSAVLEKDIMGENISKIVSEYDQEIPQSQAADNAVTPRGRATQPSRDTRKTN